MKRLLPLLACSTILLVGCQNGTSHESESKPVDLQETTPAPASVEQQAVDSDAITTETGNVPAQTTAPAHESEDTALKAYIDPETGELTVPPEEERLKQESQTSTQQEATEQEPPELIPLEGGGYKIPLGDRFQVESTGTAPAEETTSEE
jgi:hypothetical protein